MQRLNSRGRTSANADRRRAHILQEEAFLQWHSHHCGERTRASESTMSTDQSNKLLGVTKDATVADIRCTCTESVSCAVVAHCLAHHLAHQLHYVLRADRMPVFVPPVVLDVVPNLVTFQQYCNRQSQSCKLSCCRIVWSMLVVLWLAS